MCSEEVKFYDEESIDRERIINDEHQILNEFICPICFCLLWKPRSCSSCENLFCNNCIQRWLNENSNTCPYCRSLYEEKPASLSIQSNLSNYSIQCRNTSFGCKEILPYDLLEQHESIHCKFLTKKCCRCEQIVLVTDIDQHKNKCKHVVQCTLCQRSVNIELFEQHREECLQRNSNLYEDLILPPNFLTQMVLSTTTSTVDFVGIEMFNQSRQKNFLIRFYAMIQLISSNLPLIHLILLNFFAWGLGNLTIYFQSLIDISIYQVLIISILFNYTLYFLFQLVNDMLIILFIIFSLIIWSSIDPTIQVNEFQMNFNSKEILLFSILIFLFLEIPLLIIRFYFDHIPIHIGTISLVLGIFCYSNTFKDNL